MTFRCVLFDLDGTLLDTLEDLVLSANLVLSRKGFPEHSPEAYKFFIGDGVDTLMLRILPEEHRTLTVLTECIEEMRKEYAHRWREHSRPYPGIVDLLKNIHGKIRLAVLSNKPDDFTRRMVKDLLGEDYFDIVRGALPDMPKKPDPLAALRISEELRIPPQEFLYLGDTNTDMKTAVAAGMFPVGVLWGFRPASELLESGARLLIEAPGEVLRILAAGREAFSTSD